MKSIISNVMMETPVRYGRIRQKHHLECGSSIEASFGILHLYGPSNSIFE